MTSLLFITIPLFIIFVENTISVEEKGYVIKYSDGTFITVGSPPQPMVTFIDFTFAGLMVLDSECGVKSIKCPRYCDLDPLFSQMYCNSLCIDFDEFDIDNYCLNDKEILPYYANESKTFNNTGISSLTWLGQTITSEKLLGYYGRDFVSFRRSSNVEDQPILFNFTDFTFVRALKLIFNPGYSAVLGLAPPSLNDIKTNFIIQLYEQNKIDQPIILFYHIFHEDPPFYDYQGLMMLGGQIYEKCSELTVVPTVGNSWTFIIPQFCVNDVCRTNITAFVENLRYDTFLPGNMLDELVYKNILIVSVDTDDTGNYYYLNTNVTYSFVFENYTYKRRQKFSKYDKVNPSYLIKNDNLKYESDAQIVFGSRHFDDFCTLYDYSSSGLKFGIANNNLNL